MIMLGAQPIFVFEKLRCYFDVVWIFCCLVRESRCLFVFPLFNSRNGTRTRTISSNIDENSSTITYWKISGSIFSFSNKTYTYTCATQYNHNNNNNSSSKNMILTLPCHVVFLSYQWKPKKTRTAHDDSLDFSMQHSPGNLLMWWIPIEMPKLNIENVVKLVFNGNLKSVSHPSHCVVLILSCVVIPLPASISSSC